jgi:hypothetical protein
MPESTVYVKAEFTVGETHFVSLSLPFWGLVECRDLLSSLEGQTVLVRMASGKSQD